MQYLLRKFKEGSLTALELSEVFAKLVEKYEGGA